MLARHFNKEMFKPLIAAAAAAPLFAGAAFAGPYVNVETNAGWTGDDYKGATTDLHVGFEGDVGKLGYYIQGGPAISAVADVDGTETRLSGKLGGKFDVTQKLGVYGEVSGVSNDEADNTYGTKIGAKFKF